MSTHIKITVENDIVVYLPKNAIGFVVMPGNIKTVHVFSMQDESLSWNPMEPLEYFEKEIMDKS